MSNQPTAVLFVEDDPGHARLVRGALSRARERFDLDWQTSLAAGIESLQAHRFDAVLLDLTLPDSQGIETVIAVRRHAPELPIVVLTSLESNEVAQQALDRGAQDYLVKESIVGGGGTELVVRSLRHAIFRQHSLLETQRLLASLQESQTLLERKNRRLDKLCKTARRFVDDVSHEFRTPLTVIKEYVSLMRDGLVGPITAEQAQFLNVVMDRSDDLNRMVDDMLDVSKLRAGLLAVRRSACRVTTLMERVRRSLELKAGVKGVSLEMSVEPNLPEVYCDSDKIEHVIINLGVNAVKYCGEPGRVSIWAKPGATESEVLMGVTDNGPGISSRDQRRIFRRFRQLKRATRDSTKGFGLGLSIAKELVDLNFGRISLDSRSGVGSTFSFTLPVAQPTEVVRRYLSRLRCSRSGEPPLTFMTAETQEWADQEGGDALDSFLSYLMRPMDLLFRLDVGHWAMLLPTDADGVERFRHRSEKLLRDTNRNRLHGALPDFVLREVSHWQSASQAAELLTEIDQFMRPASQEICERGCAATAANSFVSPGLFQRAAEERQGDCLLSKTP
ncbi:MAG: hybrid sensor histidine kinase/response regulator [Planctomycetes bacterium]|nr:hybrid sensor histidine kinase/response regulator [Planctomycetota bacterium]